MGCGEPHPVCLFFLLLLLFFLFFIFWNGPVIAVPMQRLRGGSIINQIIINKYVIK